MENNFPCICGHSKEDHPEVGSHDYQVCEGCFRKYINKLWQPIYELACKKYKPDNLKYLEQLYEKKNS